MVTERRMQPSQNAARQDSGVWTMKDRTSTLNTSTCIYYSRDDHSELDEPMGQTFNHKKK